MDEVKDALLKRALGFDSDEIVEEYVTDDSGKSVLSKRKVTKKYTPPDMSALKVLIEQAEFDDEISHMTDKELLREKDRLLKLLAEKEKEDENSNV